MLRKLFSIICLLQFALNVNAQYAPQAGIAGSDAVHKTSSLITRWATGCHIQRGLQDISDVSLGYVTSGDSSMALGIADGSLVSLGDSGIAVLTFATPIQNGPGADFAVFENGFLNPANPEEAFLELAFVEVSSDGINFFRFPATSLTQYTSQLSSIVGQNYMNARLLHNLAGKYISSYGTPFDLQELSGIAGLNINQITHVRLVDVVGAINNYACLDASGRKVNDPYPTAFPTGGFDLDAVAVLGGTPAGISNIGNLALSVFPNPATDKIIIKREATGGISNIKLSDATGRLLMEREMSENECVMNIAQFATGIYYLTVLDENGNKWVGKVFRQ